MNNKGQLGVLGWLFGLIVFVLIWAFFLGKFINDWASQSITENGITGFNAFLLANMNLWIALFLILAVGIGYYAFGGQR